MKSIKYLISTLLLAAFTTANAGGGWTQGKGKGFFMLSQRYIGGSYYANNFGEIIDLNGGFSSVLSTHLYGEFGIRKNTDIIFHSPLLVSSHYLNSGNSTLNPALAPYDARNTGFGDIDFAIKQKLFSKNIQISASLQVGIPTGKYKPGAFGNFDPIIGDGDFNQLLRIDASKGFGNNFFYTVFGGFNNRTNGFSDEIHLGGEIGKNGNKLVSILKVYFLKSLENGGNAVAGIPGIYSNNLEYLAISPCFLYKFNEKSGLMLDLGFAPYLRNIIAAPSFTLGVWLKR